MFPKQVNLKFLAWLDRFGQALGQLWAGVGRSEYSPVLHDNFAWPRAFQCRLFAVRLSHLRRANESVADKSPLYGRPSRAAPVLSLAELAHSQYSLRARPYVIDLDGASAPS